MSNENLVRLELRVPSELRARLYARAETERRSGNSTAIVLLERALDEDEQHAAAAS